MNKLHHSAREGLRDGSFSALFKNRTGQHGFSKAVIRHEVAVPPTNSFGIVFHGIWFTLGVVVVVVGAAALVHFASKSSKVRELTSLVKRYAAKLLRLQPKSASFLRQKARHSNILSQALTTQTADTGSTPPSQDSRPAASPAVEMVDLSKLGTLSNSLGVKPILSRTDVATLTPHLPARYRNLRRWELVFSSTKHGYRLEALYDCVQAFGQQLATPAYSDPFVLVIRTTEGKKIGAFGSHRLVGVNSRFAGNGETLIFSLYPAVRIYGCNPRLARSTSHYWSATARSLVFGAGKEPALWLDQHLEHGRSEGSPTFASTQPLTGSGNEDFLCSGVELWSLASAV